VRKHQDQQLLEAFGLMTMKERSFYIDMFQAHTAGRQDRKPVLTLIAGRSAQPVSNALRSGLDCVS
jgi:hypothetical protein